MDLTRGGGLHPPLPSFGVADAIRRHASNRDLDKITPGITVLPMTTMTFKIEDEKAQLYRRQAKAAGLTLSEFIRRKIDGDESNNAQKPAKTVMSEYSGIEIFAGDPNYIPLTCESVKEMLSDFP